MSVKQSDYETLLSRYSNWDEAIALIEEYRPYLELLPSARRSSDSAISIPLPAVKIRNFTPDTAEVNFNPISWQTILLPCDLAILTCDPEWKIKMGEEILIFIHRPEEDFSNLLGRWRRTQVLLDKDYEWLMPRNAEDMLSQGAGNIYPLFVVFEATLDRIKRGLAGANLPFTVQKSEEIGESFRDLPTLSAAEE
ncbi:MAG: hypothetical protein ACFBSE_09165 [Prochloraceae cyanobacterium]